MSNLNVNGIVEKHINNEEAKALNSISSNEDDVMERIIQHIGEMGTYQRWLFVVMMPFGVIFAFVYAVQMFAAATPQHHWCKVPELQHLEINLRRNLSIPGAASAVDWDRCLVFDANWTKVLETMSPPDPNTNTIPCQNGWEFLFDDIPYPTVISEREWVCDKSGYGPLAQAVFFVGSLVGCGLFGWMGDNYGRVPALIGANMIGFVGGVTSVFTVGLWDFAFCRFLVGLSNDSCFMMLYILVLEYVGPSHRTWMANMSIGLYCVIGALLIPVLALWLMNWRRLLIVTSLPMLLALATPWIVPESARWLASTGKVKRAVAVLRKFERVNRRKIPEHVLEEFIATSSTKQVTDESLTALFKSPALRRSMVVLIIVGMISSICIDAIIRMSETIGSSLFITYGISAVVELPALLLLTLILDRLGRRSVTAGTVTLAGICSLLCAIVPSGLPQTILAVLTRFFINMSICVVMQLGAEFLPTGIRASGSSLLHVTIYIAATMSPFVVYSGRLWRPMPLIILGVASLFAGGLSMMLPETKGRPMPQTIAEGEKLVTSSVICGKPEPDEELEDLQLKKHKMEA